MKPEKTAISGYDKHDKNEVETNTTLVKDSTKNMQFAANKAD